MSAATRVVVVDDEPLAREKLLDFLDGRPGYRVVREAADGEAAVRMLCELAPDLVFLDVEMPGVDGFGVLEELAAGPMPAVVFVTAYDQYAVRAFEVRALDYLLKPFNRARFEEALARFEERRAAGPAPAGSAEALLDLVAELRARRGYPERIPVRVGPRIEFVTVREIEWIEADGNYARLHLPGRAFLLRDTMTGIERRLDPERFLRIHRSAIVNLDAVSTVEPYFHGEYVVTLRNGTKLTATRTYAARLRERLR